MSVFKKICNVFNLLSLFLKRHADWICCIYLIGWFWINIEYFFYYDRFFQPHEGEIKHYLDFSVAGWIFLFMNYSTLKPWGKITCLGFTGMLILNSYQVHVNFDDMTYFIAWVASIFLIVLIGYCVVIAKYLTEMFNPNT